VIEPGVFGGPVKPIVWRLSTVVSLIEVGDAKFKGAVEVELCGTEAWKAQ